MCIASVVYCTLYPLYKLYVRLVCLRREIVPTLDGPSTPLDTEQIDHQHQHRHQHRQEQQHFKNSTNNTMFVWDAWQQACVAYQSQQYLQFLECYQFWSRSSDFWNNGAVISHWLHVLWVGRVRQADVVSPNMISLSRLMRLMTVIGRLM